MADQVETANSTASASPAPATPAKRGRPKSKKTGTVPVRPPTSEMVTEAIETLQERGGSSFRAIKKYIVTTFKLDAAKQAHFIKKYLRAAVAAGILTQTRGTGAAGSFKIAVVKPDPRKSRSERVAARHSTSKAPVTSKRAAGKKVAAKESSAASTKEKRKIAKSPAAKPPKAKTQTKAKKAAKPAISKANTPTKIAVSGTRASPKKAVPSKKK